MGYPTHATLATFRMDLDIWILEVTVAAKAVTD